MYLMVPEHFKIYRIIGIDPGLNNLGVAIFDIDYSTRTIVRIEAFTLINDKLIDNTGLDEEHYSERNIKLYKLKDNLQSSLKYIKPCMIACESPFYSSFRPTAYAALVEVIRIIQLAILEYNSNVPFYTVEPLLVKKQVGAGMTKGKQDVKSAIMNKPDLINVLVNDINSLDEHSIDAIAVGYTFLKTSGG
jgi:Holliday junction resolvasome RuvABC endonuclease subunit